MTTTNLEISNIIASDADANVSETTQNISDMQSVKAKSVRGVLSYVGRSLVMQIIAVIASFAFGYFLTPGEYGVYYIVTAALGMLTFLSDVGLASALVQKDSEPTLLELRTTFTVQQALAIGIFLITVLLTPYWRQAHQFDGVELTLLYVVAASFFIISFKTIPSILLTRQLRFDWLALPAVVENIVFYTIAVILAAVGRGVESFIWAVIARDIVGVVLMLWLQPWSMGIAFSWPAFRHLLRYGAKFQINDLLARIKDDLFTVVIVGAWLDNTALGYIGWAKRFTNMPQQFTIANITAVTFPTYARLQSNKALLRKGIEKTLYFITLVALPLLMGLVLFYTPFMAAIPKYQKWLPAAPLVAFFAINIALSTISTPLTNTLNAIGEINKTLQLMIMWTVLTWIVTPPLIWWLGYNGVGVAAALIGVSSFVTVWMVQKLVPFSFWEQIWRPLVATAAMGVFAWLTMPLWANNVLTIFAGAALTGLVYVIVLLVIGAKSLRKELESIGVWPLPLLSRLWR